MGAVQCQEVAERSTDYLEDALPPDQRRRYEQHLAGCDVCREGLLQLQTLIRLAGRLPAPTLSPALRERLLAAFHDRHTGSA